MNELGVPEDDRYSNGGRIRGERYGSWMRKHAPIAFNVGLGEYRLRMQ